MGLSDKVNKFAEEDEKRLEERAERFRVYLEERKARMDQGNVPDEKRPV